MTNIVFITGGSGARGLAREMARRDVNTAHIIGVADSGRSTRQLRLMFNMPAIGDLRSRLIDLADTRTPGYRDVSALLKLRLSDRSRTAADTFDPEVMSIRLGSHPLCETLHASGGEIEAFATIIETSIETFDVVRVELERSRGMRFDFSQASIGNLFLTGAYLHYRRNLEAAIFLYQQLANVRGTVIPASLRPDLNLVAEYADGQRVVGQHNITKNARVAGFVGLSYLDKEDLEKGTEIVPELNPLNPRAYDAILRADMIVFSMGSFYTSILATLYMKGLAEAIRRSSAIKVFTANTLCDTETGGLTAGMMAQVLIDTLRGLDSRPSDLDEDYLHHVVVGHPFGLNVDSRRLVLDGTLPRGLRKHFVLLEKDTAHYRPAELADELLKLAA